MLAKQSVGPVQNEARGPQPGTGSSSPSPRAYHLSPGDFRPLQPPCLMLSALGLGVRGHSEVVHQIHPGPLSLGWDGHASTCPEMLWTTHLTPTLPRVQVPMEWGGLVEGNSKRCPPPPSAPKLPGHCSRGRQ